MIIKPAQVSYWCHLLLILKYLNQVIIKHRSGGLHQMEKIRKNKEGTRNKESRNKKQGTRNKGQVTSNKNQGVKKNGKKDISTSILLKDRSSVS